jgi:hypothetical protein
MEEKKKDRIITDLLEVKPAKRSSLGVVMLGILPFLILGGIVYAGYLTYERTQEWEPEVQKEIPQEVQVNFDEEGKLKNVIDPFAGHLPDASKIIQEKADFGDAPEETSVIGQVDYELFGSFPTLLDDRLAGSIRHLEPEQSFFLGMRKYNDGVTLETDAEVTNFDEDDDGVIFPKLNPCEKSGLQVEVSIPKGLSPPYYLNALADWDRSGNWNGMSACKINNESFEIPEWFIQNIEGGDFYDVGQGDSRRLIIPDFLVGPKSGETWFRFTLTNEPVVREGKDWDGSGYFMRGETEDYLAPVHGTGVGEIGEIGEIGEMGDNELLAEKENDSELADELLPEYEDILDEPIFYDVAANDWYAPFVKEVTKRGIMNGYSDNSFQPSYGVTRAELLTIALRMRNEALQGDPVDSDGDGLIDLEEMILQTDPKNIDSNGNGSNDYREVMNNANAPIPLDTIWSKHWARGNVAKALMLGFISTKSFPENRFHPDGLATKEFALIVLLRASGKQLPHEDVLKSAEMLELISDADNFDGGEAANRAMVAKLVSLLTD